MVHLQWPFSYSSHHYTFLTVIILTSLHPFTVILLTLLLLFTVILLKPLHPIHFHCLYSVYTPSANIISTFRWGLSASTSSEILLVHLVMTCPGQHRQPHYWYVLSWLIRVEIFSHIVDTSFHGLSVSTSSAILLIHPVIAWPVHDRQLNSIFLWCSLVCT